MAEMPVGVNCRSGGMVKRYTMSGYEHVRRMLEKGLVKGDYQSNALGSYGRS